MKSFLQFLKESKEYEMRMKKIQEIVNATDCSDIEDALGDDVLEESDKIGDAESPFGMAGSETFFGGTGEELNESEDDQKLRLGNDFVTESDTYDNLYKRNRDREERGVHRSSQDVRNMAAQYRVEQDDSSACGYKLMRKEGRFSDKRHELTKDEIEKSILPQLNRPPKKYDVQVTDDGELYINNKLVSNIRSKKKWIKKVNDIYKKLYPDTTTNFTFELKGKTDDGADILGNRITRNLTPLKQDKDDSNILDIYSSEYVPIDKQNDEDIRMRQDIQGIISSAANKKKKDDTVYGYNFEKKCFTTDGQDVTDKKEFFKIVNRLNGGVKQSDDERWNHFVFTKEGSKIGNSVGSFSLPPVHSCQDGVPCAHQGCYALKSYALYPQVAAGWDNNLAKLEDGDYEQFIKEAVDFINGRVYKTTTDENGNTVLTDEIDEKKSAKSKKFTHFRFQVSGDVFSKEYRDALYEVCKQCKNTIFWLYTKNYNVFKGSSKPNNLTVILSAWGEFQPPKDMLDKFPVAFLYDKKDPNIEKYCPKTEAEGGTLKICPCTQANANKVTCEQCEICFTRKAYNNLAFRKH